MNDSARFPCAQCGAALRFSPTEQQLVCAHCGHIHPVETSDIWGDGGAPELSYATALSDGIDAAPVETIETVHCQECGATTNFDPNVKADACPFCASPLVAEAGARRQFKPAGALPFALTEREAKAALARWLKGLWFAPNDVAAYARSERQLNGVYLPFWTFDANTRSSYRGARGKVEYVTRMRSTVRNGKRVQAPQRVAKVRWTPVVGTVRRAFDDVLVLATRTLPHRFAERLNGGRAAWDMHDLQPYQPEFLAGFRAEAYTLDLEEGFHAARAIMDLQIRRDVRFDIGGDRQKIYEVDTEVDDTTFKHVLLPVWIAAYRYDDAVYRFVVNGRTGEVIGERPYSRWKIALAVAGALVVAAVIALFSLGG